MTSAFEAINNTLTLMGRQLIPSYVQRSLDIAVVGLAFTSFYLRMNICKMPIEDRPYSELTRLKLLKGLVTAC